MAFRNLDAAARNDLTVRYDALCAHYGIEPTRNNRRVAHEKGSIVCSRGHIKAAWRFIDEIVSRHNARQAKAIEAERATLRRLPNRRTSDYEETPVIVTSSGGSSPSAHWLSGRVHFRRGSARKLNVNQLGGAERSGVGNGSPAICRGMPGPGPPWRFELQCRKETPRTVQKGESRVVETNSHTYLIYIGLHFFMTGWI